MEEKIINIEVENIKDFPSHPFNVKKDNNYFELEESIIENGILIPAIVRKTKKGKYEMVSGHRRKNICIENNIEKIPCIVKDLTDEEAIVFMVDTNLQREKILPSEKARAYKMKYDLLRYKDKLSPVGTNEKDSRTQIYRYIRLNYLIPELMQLVDDTVLKDKRSSLTMGIRPAVELSYLTEEEQQKIYSEITYQYLTPSYYQAKRIRELSETNKLDSDEIESIFLEQKPNQSKRISLNEERIRSVLPKNIKDYKIEDFIIEAIKRYSDEISLDGGDEHELEI